VAEWRNAEIARHVVLKGTPLSITEAEIDAMFGKGTVYIYTNIFFKSYDVNNVWISVLTISSSTDKVMKVS
jgi:hypothetical protein